MTAQSAWTELVAKNPMLIEVSRYRRKLFSFSRSNPMGGMIVAMVAIAYVGIVSMIVSFRTDISPFVLIDIQTAIFMLIAPILLHSAIAGERERRSWDLLLAAPITKAQIVVGKFLGALSAMAIGAAFFVFPIAVTALSYHPQVYNYGYNGVIVDPTQNLVAYSTSFWNLALAEMVCLSATALVSAITIFFSARVKRSFMALGTTLGLMVLGLMVLPAMAEPTLNAADPVLIMHPVFALGRLSELGMTGHQNQFVSDAWIGFPQILFYLGLTGVMLAWSVNTLNFAENEVKFLPKAKTRC